MLLLLDAVEESEILLVEVGLQLARIIVGVHKTAAVLRHLLHGFIQP